MSQNGAGLWQIIELVFSFLFQFTINLLENHNIGKDFLEILTVCRYFQDREAQIQSIEGSFEAAKKPVC